MPNPAAHVVVTVNNHQSQPTQANHSANAAILPQPFVLVVQIPETYKNEAYNDFQILELDEEGD